MRVFLIFILFFSQLSLNAKEKLGDLTVDEIALKPLFLLEEPQQGDFQLGDSYISFLWKMGTHFSSHIKIADNSLLNRSALYKDYSLSQTPEFGIIEGYGKYTGIYGTIEFGLIPIRYGKDGMHSESELELPRNLLFKNHLIPLRDFGFSLSSQKNGYFTHLAFHNGESGLANDGRIWLTGIWGVEVSDFFSYGVMGHTGTAKSSVTGSSSLTVAGFDKAKDSTWTNSGAFVDYANKDIKSLIELTVGELEQKGNPDAQYYAGHLDIDYNLNHTWSTLFRYDYFEPSNKSPDDIVREITLGFAIRNKQENAKFYILLTKIEEESTPIGNDQLRLVWRLSP